MGVVIRKVLGHVPNVDGSWTFLVEVDFGATIVDGCRVTVPTERVRGWMKSAGLDAKDLPMEPTSVGGDTTDQ